MSHLGTCMVMMGGNGMNALTDTYVVQHQINIKYIKSISNEARDLATKLCQNYSVGKRTYTTAKDSCFHIIEASFGNEQLPLNNPRDMQWFLFH